MSECKYESAVTKVVASAAQIYKVFSNLKNLERVKDLIPKDKVQELEIEDESCAVSQNHDKSFFITAKKLRTLLIRLIPTA